MNPIRLWWWDTLLNRRRYLLFFAARFPAWPARLVRLRALLHFLVGHVHVTAGLSLVASVVVVGEFSWPSLALVVALVLFVDVCMKAVLYWRGGPGLLAWFRWVAAWRESLSVRSRLPSDWAEVAHRTQAIQAEVGSAGGGEPRAPARLRPIADHPKLSWVPRIDWPRVSFICSPPPGRSFEAWDKVLIELAATIPRVSTVLLSYGSSGASIGTVTFVFIDQLTDSGPADLEGMSTEFTYSQAEIDAARAVALEAIDITDVLDTGEAA